jgi:kinesin family protein 1
MINLAQARTEYSHEQQNLVKNTFSITTKENGFLIQTLNEKELHDWLYAINPLLAGKIRYINKPAEQTKPRPAGDNI